MPRRILLIQCGIVSLCAIALAQFALNFPFPSPFIKPFLPPETRWPTAQVKAWVETGAIDRGFLEFFTRDPERVVPLGKNLVAPADGVVLDTSFENGISDFVVGLSFWDVHVIRTPVAGVVKDIEQEGSLFLYERSSSSLQQKPLALRGKSAPVQAIVILDTEEGDVKVRLITSYWASRLRIWVQKGQRLEKGERIGRILLGSTVVAEFPGQVEFGVRPPQRVVAGETIISGGDVLQ